MILSFLKYLVAAAIGLAVLVVPTAAASVVMNGTRVIYDGGSTGKSLQFNSEGQQPSIVQVWLDTGDAASTPQSADAPFVATPQIFRIEPHAGQTVRLLYTGTDAPSDRESVYYLNFSQVPAMRDSSREASKLVLMFNSRMKLFYRPAGLPPMPDDMATALRMRREGTQLRVQNPTPYHVVVRSAQLLQGDNTHELASALMIAPFSEVTWPMPVHGQAVRLVLVNDYGADVTRQVALP